MNLLNADNFFLAPPAPVDLTEQSAAENGGDEQGKNNRPFFAGFSAAAALLVAVRGAMSGWDCLPVKLSAKKERVAPSFRKVGKEGKCLKEKEK